MAAGEIVAGVREGVASVGGIAAIYLFGSVAAGTDTPSSDVDLGVLYDAAPPDLRIRVLRAQQLVVERDRAARIRFEVATRNEFFDPEPMLRA